MEAKNLINIGSYTIAQISQEMPQEDGTMLICIGEGVARRSGDRHNPERAENIAVGRALVALQRAKHKQKSHHLLRNSYWYIRRARKQEVQPGA